MRLLYGTLPYVDYAKEALLLLPPVSSMDFWVDAAFISYTAEHGLCQRRPFIVTFCIHHELGVDAAFVDCNVEHALYQKNSF